MSRSHVMGLLLSATMLTAGTAAARADGEIYTAQGSRIEVKLVPEKATIRKRASGSGSSIRWDREKHRPRP